MHPRPQLRRPGWICLDGEWEFALDPEGRWDRPDQVTFDRTIRVPFSPEAPASGIGDTGLYRGCWYRTRVEPPALHPGERLVLRFGAVDWASTVWIDGARSAYHEGGYTPFHVDLGAIDRPFEIVVWASDDPTDLAKPRGKQDWLREPHSIWYPRTTGIWQTVWLERLPSTWIDVLRWTPHLARWEIGMEARLEGARVEGATLDVSLVVRDEEIARDRYAVVAGEIHRRIALSDPGIDDYRNEYLWAPHSPTLFEARLSLRDPEGRLLDEVESYTALRSIAIQEDRFVLNGRPYQLRLVLDQGYWEGCGPTPPDDEAIRRDVELAKAMGFNGVRKHQKLEDPRYLHLADRLGLLVWEEMPSAYRFTTQSIERVTREWIEALRRDYSHPCIVTWVPLNESWGVPNLPDNAAEREYVRALYHLTKTLDPTRPVIGNDGWESVATDLIGIHDYDPDPERFAQRYHADLERARLFRRERPAGRVLHLGTEPSPEHPLVLSEFGGIALGAADRGQWGYSRSADAADFARRFRALLDVVRTLRLFAGFCYTQFADTFQEVNGLLTSDRTPKVPLEEIAQAVRGPMFYSDVSMPPAPKPGGDAPAGDPGQEPT